MTIHFFDNLHYEKNEEYQDTLEEVSLANFYVGLATYAPIPATPNLGLSLSSAYFDCLNGLMSAALYILDDLSHKQTENKVKAGLLAFSAVEVSLFSYAPWLDTGLKDLISHTAKSFSSLPGTELAGIAGTVATLIDLGITIAECDTARQMLDFKKWLDHRLKMIAHLQKKIDKINLKLPLDEALTDKQNKLYDKSLVYQNAIKVIRNEIEIRCIANSISEDTNEADTQMIEDIQSTISTNGFAEYPGTTKPSVLRSKDNFFNKIFLTNQTPNKELIKARFQKERLRGESFAQHTARNERNKDIRIKEQEIKDNLKEDYKELRNLTLFKTLSFVGCVLLTISPFAGPLAPGLFIAGLVISSFAAASIIYVKRRKIKEKAKMFVDFIKEKMTREATKLPQFGPI